MESNYLYGGFFQRTAAMLIDAAILMFFYLVLLIIAWAQGDWGSSLSSCWRWQSLPSIFILYFLAAGLGNMLYFTYFHAVTGQTIGKRLMGLKVVTLYNEELSWCRSFFRWCGYFISKWFFFLGFFWVAISSQKRGWHDYIAGTVVIRLGVTEPLTKNASNN